MMQGQYMKSGLHFNETHAPVPSPTLLCTFFSITAAEGRNFRHLDVKAAFLTVPLDVELDVILPEGFVFAEGTVPSMLGTEGRRCRALTAIPGCPQGTSIWRATCWRPSTPWVL